MCLTGKQANGTFRFYLDSNDKLSGTSTNFQMAFPQLHNKPASNQVLAGISNAYLTASENDEPFYYVAWDVPTPNVYHSVGSASNGGLEQMNIIKCVKNANYTGGDQGSSQVVGGGTDGTTTDWVGNWGQVCGVPQGTINFRILDGTFTEATTASIGDLTMVLDIYYLPAKDQDAVY